MSCIFFGAEELANVARAVNSYETRHHGRDVLPLIAMQLAKISLANAEAYGYRYQRETPPTPVDAKRIDTLARQGKANFEEALSCLMLLHYNCCEGEDYLEAQAGGLAALAELQARMLGVWLDEKRAKP
jgi:hypothetical protein